MTAPEVVVLATDGNGGAGSSRPRGFRLLGSILTESHERIEWLVPGIIAPGVLTILSAEPKAGKSTLVAAWLDALATGGDFLGDTLPQTQSVWRTEERPPTLLPKVERWPGLETVETLMLHERDGRDWPELIADATHLALASGARLLVVDTFAAWAQLAGDDEQSSGHVLAAMKSLAEAAGKGLAVLLVTHERKSGGDYGRGVRGSGALVGAVDIIVQLTRSTAEQPTRRRLSFSSRFPDTPEALHITLGPDGYHLAEAETASKDNGDDELLLRHLRADGRTVGDLQELAVLSDKRTRAGLARLYEAGLAARDMAPGSARAHLYSLAAASLSISNPISGEASEASDAAPCGITGHTTSTTPTGDIRCVECPAAAASTAEQLAL